MNRATSPAGYPLIAVIGFAIAFSQTLSGSSVYQMPLENGPSASLQNFGSAGGLATSVSSPYNIAPAPTTDNTQSRSGWWSLHCIPSSVNPAYAGTLLLPNSAARFRMDSASSKMTIGAWVRWDGVFGSNNRYGIVTTLNPSHTAGWALYIDNAGKVGYRFNVLLPSGQVAARERATTTAVITPGQWTHVAATIDCSITGNSALTIFIDGVPKPTSGASLGSNVHVPATGSEVGIGSFTKANGGGGHQSLNGYLDDLQIWDSSFSAAKIRAMNEAQALLPNHNTAEIEALFSAFDAQQSAEIGDLTWSYTSTGLDVSGRELGDVWLGSGGQYHAWLGGTAQNPVGMVGTPKRTNFAHYMAPYVAGSSLFDWVMTGISRFQDPASTDLHYAMGAGHGGLTNLPLVPQGMVLTAAQSAELEIKRAIRAGFDGFVIDAWAGNEGAKTTVNELIAAAARLGVDFKVTICIDPSCHTTPPDGVMVQTFADSINWLIDNHGDSPHLARRHGKVLIFGYQTFNILKNSPLKSQPSNPAWWAEISNAWNQVRALVSEPIFLHADVDTMIERAPAQHVAIAEWAGANFDAVGGFLGNWAPEKNSEIASAVQAEGAEWSQPIFPHYYSRGGGYIVEPGTDKLRSAYEAARSTGATLLQVATWNDYGENTHIAPAYSNGYTLMHINRYQSDWWKSAAEPSVTQDQVHLVFRRALDGKMPWPFGMRRQVYNEMNILEVTTLLTAPGTVNVPGYGSYQAPAGLNVEQFPLQVGSISASVSRGSTTVVSATSPERVTDKPFREDHSMACFSSNYLSDWVIDFGATSPLLYSEYGDIDSDGLPNWFEMYYFGDGVADTGEIGWRGDFPIMSLASSPDSRAAPTADPDGDGFTNLQEYTNRTDPKTADVLYPTGFIWDTNGIEARGLSFNGDQDSHRKSVWFYYYRHGAVNSIPQDGNYDFMNSSGNIWSGTMSQNGPHWDPDGISYGNPEQLGSFISRRQVGGVWQTRFEPRNNAAAILCWKSPVTGVVSLSFSVVEVSSYAPSSHHRPFIINVRRNQEATVLGTVSLLPGQTGSLAPLSISVQKGDSIYLFSHSGGPYGGSTGFLQDIKVTLLQNNGQ